MMTEPEKQIHPIIRGMVGFAIAVLVATFAISLIPPAWALAVPIGNLFVIDLGDLPPWIGAIVAIFVYLEARKARKSAAEAVTGIAVVKAQTDGVLEKVAAMSKREGKAEEKEEEVAKVAAAKNVASADAVRDAGTAAAIAAATPPNGTKKA